jgi:hypothetical protein
MGSWRPSGQAIRESSESVCGLTAAHPQPDIDCCELSTAGQGRGPSIISRRRRHQARAGQLRSYTERRDDAVDRPLPTTSGRWRLFSKPDHRDCRLISCGPFIARPTSWTTGGRLNSSSPAYRAQGSSVPIEAHRFHEMLHRGSRLAYCMSSRFLNQGGHVCRRTLRVSSHCALSPPPAGTYAALPNLAEPLGEREIVAHGAGSTRRWGRWTMRGRASSPRTPDRHPATNSIGASPGRWQGETMLRRPRFSLVEGQLLPGVSRAANASRSTDPKQ